MICQFIELPREDIYHFFVLEILTETDFDESLELSDQIREGVRVALFKFYPPYVTFKD